MLFLREYFSPSDGVKSMLVENKETGEKDVYIKGVFTEADSKNRNNRIYPEHLLDREMYKLQKQIAEGSLTGELDHPAEPEPKLANAAFKIISIQKEGKTYIGEGKIMKEVPRGKIAYGLAKEGIQFGVSSRSLGSVKNKNGIMEVQDDLNWLTCDLVGDPSCQKAMVETIFEQKEWLIEDGIVKEDVLATLNKQLKSLTTSQLKEGTISIFESFIRSI